MMTRDAITAINAETFVRYMKSILIRWQAKGFAMTAGRIKETRERQGQTEQSGLTFIVS